MVARALLLAACAALGGCGGDAPARGEAIPRSAFIPEQSIRGALLSPGVDAAGAPRPATGPYTPLQNPIAVAAFGPELYVVDGALGALLRIDVGTNVMVQFARRPFQPGTRLAVGADATLYVLDTANRRVRRFARDGRLLADYAVDAAVGDLTDLALDPARGRLLAADGLHRQLVAFRPLGRAFEILPLRGEPRHALGALRAIAVGGDDIYASDPRCGCLVRIAPDGVVLGTFGHERVLQPERLVADRHGRVIVFDRADRSLKLFVGARLAERIELARLGLNEATDLALDEDRLYVADGPGAQVRLLRLRAAPKDPR